MSSEKRRWAFICKKLDAMLLRGVTGGSALQARAPSDGLLLGVTSALASPSRSDGEPEENDEEEPPTSVSERSPLSSRFSLPGVLAARRKRNGSNAAAIGNERSATV